MIDVEDISILLHGGTEAQGRILADAIGRNYEEMNITPVQWAGILTALQYDPSDAIIRQLFVEAKASARTSVHQQSLSILPWQGTPFALNVVDRMTVQLEILCIPKAMTQVLGIVVELNRQQVLGSDEQLEKAARLFLEARAGQSR